MPGSDQHPETADRAERLNDDWDALVRGQNTALDPAFAPTLWELHMLDSSTGPTDEFAERLWRELERAAPPPRLWRRWHALPFALAAAVLGVLLVGAALVATLWPDRPAPPGHQAVIPTTVPSPTPATPQVPVVVPTEPHMTPPLAVASPTPPTTAEVPTATPTVSVAGGDPNATVPTGPATPQPQLGGWPEYFSLADYVNNAAAIVIGTLSGPVATDEHGQTYSALEVEESVRGDVSGELLLTGVAESDRTHERYVVFLLGPFVSQAGAFYATDLFLPLEDGVIVPLDFEPLEYNVRATYGGESVDTLVADIQALPRVEEEIDDLLGHYGWTPIRKGYLWPQTLPDSGAFDGFGPFPRRAPTWATLLDASRRVGLDFAAFAGQRVQVLPYIVERDMAEGERMLLVEFVIVDQQVVGAWVVVLPGDGTAGVYGLDEHEAVVALPVAIPTPVPTPTPAIPTSSTVNPSQFYDLARTETLVLCWPYCDLEPKTVAFRDALVAALDRDLEIEPLSAHPTPTAPVELVPSDGSFVWINFGYLTSHWPVVSFGYDRASGLVLLPHGAGWVPAPPALAEAFAGVEPPLPTKEP
jgi:hypothetical protein